MKETKKLLLPSINLIDSIHKPIYIDYFILLNIKNLYSSIFYMNFFKQIIFKCNFLKRKLFFQKLITLIFKKIINEITI